MAENAGLVDILPEIGFLVGMGVIYFVIAVWRFKFEWGMFVVGCGGDPASLHPSDGLRGLKPRLHAADKHPPIIGAGPISGASILLSWLRIFIRDLYWTDGGGGLIFLRWGKYREGKALGFVPQPNPLV